MQELKEMGQLKEEKQVEFKPKDRILISKDLIKKNI